MSAHFRKFSLGYKFRLKQQKLTAKIAVVTGNFEFILVQNAFIGAIRTTYVHKERYIKRLL